MPRYIWDKDRSEFVPAEEYVRPPVARSHLPSPRFMTDTIEVRSMLDGKMYTSKANLRSTYRAAGVEEVGNDPIREVKSEISAPSGLKEDLSRAWAEHS